MRSRWERRYRSYLILLSSGAYASMFHLCALHFPRRWRAVNIGAHSALYSKQQARLLLVARLLAFSIAQRRAARLERGRFHLTLAPLIVWQWKTRVADAMYCLALPLFG